MNERILIYDLIRYKLKYRTKEARLILQSGIYNFCYQYFGQHGLVLFMWSPKKCIISTATLSFSYIFFFLNSSAFHLNSFWKKRGELDMYLLEIMIKEFMVSRVFYKQPWLNQLILDRFLTMWISFLSDFLLLFCVNSRRNGRWRFEQRAKVVVLLHA